MRSLLIYIFAFLLCSHLLNSGCSDKYYDIDNSLGRNRNVCKKLKGDVLIYTVFVDTKAGPVWTDADKKFMLGSIEDAANWTQEQAKKSNIPLSFKIESPGAQKTVSKDFPIKNTSAITYLEKKDLKKLNDWANGVVKKVAVGMTDKNEKDSLPAVVSPKDAERLIARLRNQYHVESVALFFVTNHTEKNDIGLPLHTFSNEEIEYVINSYEKPSIIAYELLSLFGADILFHTKNGKTKSDAEFALKEFPDDLMTNPFMELGSANIGDYTKFLLGWNNDLDKQYRKLLKY